MGGGEGLHLPHNPTDGCMRPRQPLQQLLEPRPARGHQVPPDGKVSSSHQVCVWRGRPCRRGGRGPGIQSNQRRSWEVGPRSPGTSPQYRHLVSSDLIEKAAATARQQTSNAGPFGMHWSHMPRNPPCPDPTSPVPAYPPQP